MKTKVRVYRLKNIEIHSSLEKLIEVNYSEDFNQCLEEVIICKCNEANWSVISKSPSIRLVILCGPKSKSIPKSNKILFETDLFLKTQKLIKLRNRFTSYIVSYYLKKYLRFKERQAFKAYLLRHGETIWNKRKIYQGTLDSKLTKKGLITTEKIAKLLKNKGLQILFSSPQKRAITTAQLISKQVKKEIKIIDQFSEMNLGIFEGKEIGMIKKLFSEYFTNRKASREAKITLPYPLGESYEDTYMRVLPAILKIACEYDNFAIVGHEGVNRLIRGILQCKGLEESVYLRQTNDEILGIDIAQNTEQVIGID